MTQMIAFTAGRLPSALTLSVTDACGLNRFAGYLRLSGFPL
jgi:hypothetical protein